MASLSFSKYKWAFDVRDQRWKKLKKSREKVEKKIEKKVGGKSRENVKEKVAGASK